MILKGDALNMPFRANSVDAVVCDPPYGLEFMGKDWDKLDNSRNAKRWENKRSLTGMPKRDPNHPSGRHNTKIAALNINLKCNKCGHYRISGTPCKCKEPEWEARENYKSRRELFAYNSLLWRWQGYSD